MITVDTLIGLAHSLGFKEENGQLTKNLNGHKFVIDTESKRISLPEKIKGKKDLHFGSPENFVVFECVFRLLQKGYNPEHIEIERTFQLGHLQKSGRADITVFSDDSLSSVLMILECKTAGSEYQKALELLFDDGGQLFSYWQQERSCEYLALYCSDYNPDQKKLSYTTHVIRCKDDENTLKLARTDANVQLYSSAYNASQLHQVWKETYQAKLYEHLIFGEGVRAYKLDVAPLRIRDLKEFSEGSRIINGFLEILRHNSVSDKENAFNRLIALFICKLVDEQKSNDQVVDFQYKVGEDNFETLQDRLQRLYKIGMEKFMQEQIYYVESDYAEKLFKNMDENVRQHAIEELTQTIKRLKFYTNNDFSFKDVHNEELFLQNGKILTEMVQLFENYRISYASKHQFLGDMFEQLLNKGFKQNEGQFFTPGPITRFIWDSLPVREVLHSLQGEYPKVIDYACGSAHFLTEAVEAFNHITPSLNNDWARTSIYGIEKDYRLARVSQVSMFMNGAGGANIIFGDGLDNTKGIENGMFDILVANPPYSIVDFKKHLRLSNNSLDVLQYVGDNGKEIEVAFLERSAQLLRSEGLAAIVLPVSILTNEGRSFVAARENLLQNFSIKAIVYLGSKTFGATGTNTVILFLQKYSYPPNQFKLSSDTATVIFNSGLKKLKHKKEQRILEAYCSLIGVPLELYDKYRLGTLSVEELSAETNNYLLQYKHEVSQRATKKSSQIQTELDFLDAVLQLFTSVEQEKMTYFAHLFKQQTLIIQSPTEVAEQKEFLGYTWSNRNGAEGIQYLNYGGKLFNPDDRESEDCLSFYVRDMFTTQNERFSEIQDSHSGLAFRIDSVTLLNLNSIDFKKSIVPSKDQLVSFKDSKYPLKKYLGKNMLNHAQIFDLLNHNHPTKQFFLSHQDKFQLTIGKRILSSEVSKLEAADLIPVFSANVTVPFGFTNKRLLTDFSVPSILWGIDGDWMVSFQVENQDFYPTDHCGVLRITSDEINPKYFEYKLREAGSKAGFSRSNRASISNIKKLVIDLPEKSIQDEIANKIVVAEKEMREALELVHPDFYRYGEK